MTQQVADTRAAAMASRSVFDVVATNDVASLLTSLRGVNPYDVSPGMQRQRDLQTQRTHAPQPPPPPRNDDHDDDRDGDDMQRTATMTAVLRGNRALEYVDVRDLARRRDGRGNTVLHVAAGLGHVQLVQLLLDECACATDVDNDDGYTPLHLAARHGRLACLRCLRAHGADVLKLTRFADAQCCYHGTTTTMTTATRGDDDADAARRHRCRDEDVDACAVGGRTAVFLAHWHQHHAVAAELAPHFCNARPLYTSRNKSHGNNNNDNDNGNDDCSNDNTPADADLHGGDDAAAMTVGGSDNARVTRSRLRASIVAAALTLDTLVFAQLFDVMDCQAPAQRTCTTTAATTRRKQADANEQRDATHRCEHVDDGDDDDGCSSSRVACGALPVRWAVHEVAHVVRGVATLLPHIVPLEANMLPEQLFIFHGLLKRGLLCHDAAADTMVTTTTSASSPSPQWWWWCRYDARDDRGDGGGASAAVAATRAWCEGGGAVVLDRVLRGGQAMAFRLLWQHEYTALQQLVHIACSSNSNDDDDKGSDHHHNSDTSSPTLLSSCVPHDCANGDGARVLRLLLQEVEQRHVFARTLAAVRAAGAQARDGDGRRHRRRPRRSSTSRRDEDDLLRAHATLQSLRHALSALHEPPLP